MIGSCWNYLNDTYIIESFSTDFYSSCTLVNIKRVGGENFTTQDKKETFSLEKSEFLRVFKPTDSVMETVEFDVPEDVEFSAMKLAHSKNITFNELILEGIYKLIEEAP